MMEFEFPKRNLDVDFDDTGFPFDDQRLNTPQSEPSSSSQPPTSSTGYPVFGARGDDSRLHFDDHLRDIAARYPEFADHIRPGVAATASAFPRERVRRDPWGRDEFDFGREFDIPAQFESRFARPREFYPPNTQTYSSSPPCQPESRPPTHPQTTPPPPPPGPKPAQTQTHPQIASNTPISATAACRAATATTTAKNPTAAIGQGIQQSNTVDLGQVQPHSAAQGAAGGGGECRGQRSMSAPPTDGGRAAAGGKRYVSSIQIPVLQQGSPQRGSGNQLGGGSQSAEMGASNSTPKQPPPPQPVQHTPNRPNEYVIPIHIEGRDEPITPKHYQPPASNSQQYTQPPPSGQNQPLFNAMKDQFSRQQEQVQKEQQQKYEEQQQKYQEQQQRECEQQEKAQIVKPTPLEMIQLIQKDVSELMSRVDRFAGRPKDKEYGYLDEMLTRNLLKLDNIETNGKDAIRRARREAIKCIEGCISILEAKANANVANETALLALEDKSGNENADGAVEIAERAMEEGQDNGVDRKEAAADVSVT